MNQIYLDNAATTKPDSQVVQAMLPFFTDEYGNPSSIHSKGRIAKKALDSARSIIANKLNADSQEIIFCSGGTEADNHAILSTIDKLKDKGNHIITSKFEHPGVLKTCQVLETKGFKITYLDITKEGIIDLNQLESKLSNNSKPILVSIMHVNNELGSIQPIKEIGALCKKHNVLFHSDCVQSFTKIPLDTKKINIDMISISSHKIHGPKGVGALWVKKGTLFKPLLSGGSQESLQRAGTENIPGIVGFSKAVEISENIDLEKIKLLKNKLIDEILKIPDTHLNGDPKSILSNFASITFKFIEGESLLMHLDLEGIQVSTGSACSSLNLQASHVLLALGLPHELCHGTIRFSLSKFTTEEDINNTINILKRVIPELRKISPFKKSYDNYEKLKN